MFSESEKAFLLIVFFFVFWLVKRFCRDRKKYDVNSSKYVYGIVVSMFTV